MNATLVSVALLGALAMSPACAQDKLMDKAADMSPDEIVSAAGNATERIRSAGKDALLLKNVFGSELKGPDGETLGTIENVVVVPGGRLVAAIVKTKDGDPDRLVVPYQAIKLSRVSGKVEAVLPLKLSDVRSKKEIQRLQSTLPNGSD